MDQRGFPDLWRTWRAQMRAIADAGNMAMAPDLRGYGETEGDPDPRKWTAMDVMGDLVAILDHVGVDQVTVIAHDWGTNTGWPAVRLRPDRFVGMFAVSVPWASDWTPADDGLIAHLRWPTVRALKPGIRFPNIPPERCRTVKQKLRSPSSMSGGYSRSPLTEGAVAAGARFSCMGLCRWN